MPPYKYSDNVYLYNIIKMMEQHMHKQLFLHQHEMYITVSQNRDFAELQLSWQDYLTNTWCYATFPFKFTGTTALCIYVNNVIKFFNTVLYYATMYLFNIYMCIYTLNYTYICIHMSI